MPKQTASAAIISPEDLQNLDHGVLGKAFGSRVAEAILANGNDNPYSSIAVRGFLRALLDGVTPVETIEEMPAEFVAARDSWRSVRHTPESFFQHLWKTRLHERFVLSEDWEQWPAAEWQGSVKTIEHGKYVPTMAPYDEVWLLNSKDSILIFLTVDYHGELSSTIYGNTVDDIDALITTVEDYVVLPDPYEGKILRMDGGGLKILNPKVGELTGYSPAVESAVDWMSSIADPKIRKQLAKADLPARAGLLLEGPPGSGKTTLARRIARDLSGNTTVIYATPEVEIETVFSFSNYYEPVLIILEDVESFFGERGESDFSSFLNELDGLDQEPGKMILATSNDSSNFDEAIRRPGRLERRAIIADVQPGAHRKMVKSRLPKESKETVKELVEIIELRCGDRPITPAVIDSLARHAIMLGLRREALVAYARDGWEPHYEGSSYLD